MTPLEKKKSPKKVRKDYIRKKIQDELLIDPATKLLGENQMFALKACNCLVLEICKIYMGLQYLNHQFLSQAIIDNLLNPNSITLNLKWTKMLVISHGNTLSNDWKAMETWSQFDPASSLKTTLIPQTYQKLF